MNGAKSMAYISDENISDMTVFRNRIISLMREKSINSSQALAKKMVETGCVTRTRPSGTVLQLKVSSLDKKIQKHLQEGFKPNELPDSLNAKHVQAYAKAFGCSVDFILGNTFVHSLDPCVRDLCNRTGLKEQAISQFLKMTDDRFAFRTLRMSPEEAREILNSLLISKETTEMIRCIGETAYAFQKDTSTIFDELEKDIGKDRIEKALEWDYILDPVYDGPSPSEDELKDVFLVREAMDKSYELQENIIRNKQFAKYQLFKSFQKLIEQMYPDD